MALSWNEIKDRALRFSNEWKDDFNEEAEAKSFLEAFFNVFGISRKKIATFEHKVKKLNEQDGYIDLLWKGTLHQFKHLWVAGTVTNVSKLKGLEPEEQELFEFLKEHNIRLEQEMIPQGYVVSKIKIIDT